MNDNITRTAFDRIRKAAAKSQVQIKDAFITHELNDLGVVIVADTPDYQFRKIVSWKDIGLSEVDPLPRTLDGLIRRIPQVKEGLRHVGS